MHRLSSSFILGYHGCDESVADRLLAGDSFLKSNNEYDWLGPGIYFWEANPIRGIEFARALKKAQRGPNIENPAVVGAVVDLGHCLDLTTSSGVEQVKLARNILERESEVAGKVLPRNSADLMRRNLDCAVIRMFHDIREKQKLPLVDTVKGIFIEGSPLYENSGFFEKTHIQICVCDRSAIKGVFRVSPDHLI